VPPGVGERSEQQRGQRGGGRPLEKFLGFERGQPYFHAGQADA
jgi:hypothetical protein